MTRKNIRTYRFNQRKSISQRFNFEIEDRPLKYDPEDQRNAFHWHDYYEIEVIHGGSGEHIINNKRVHAERGYVYIVTPIDFHTLITDEDPLQVINIAFDEKAVSPQTLELLLSLKSPIEASFNEEEFAYILGQLRHIIGEIAHSDLLTEPIVKAEFEDVCLQIIRKVKKESKQECDDELLSLQRKNTIREVVAYIKHNFKGDIRLKDIAGVFNLTPNYLGEEFAQTMGMSYSKYIISLRLNYAMDLLINSELNISQICYACGFNSESYFINSFKKNYGYTPKHYRRMIT